MELDGAQYLGFSLPFSISQLVWIEAILVGGAEIYRNRELEPQARIYPGKQIMNLPLSPLLGCIMFRMLYIVPLPICWVPISGVFQRPTNLLPWFLPLDNV